MVGFAEFFRDYGGILLGFAAVCFLTVTVVYLSQRVRSR